MSRPIIIFFFTLLLGVLQLSCSSNEEQSSETSETFDSATSRDQETRKSSADKPTQVLKDTVSPESDKKDFPNYVGLDHVDFASTDYDPSALLEVVSYVIENASLVDEVQSEVQKHFESITNLFLKKHYYSYELSSNKGSLRLPSYLALMKQKVTDNTSLQSQEDLHDFKVKLESVVGPIKSYNKLYFTLPHILESKKSQCYSSTSLFQVALREKGDYEKFQNKNLVVILTPGHILSGYLKKVGSNWNLTGVESTVEGKGRIRFGNIRDLHEYGDGAFRVLDADLWMLGEVVSSAMDSTLQGKYLKAVQVYTDLRYDQQIPIDELETKIQALVVPPDHSVEGIQSPFAFGSTSAVPDGDIERRNVDQLSRPVPANDLGASDLEAVPVTDRAVRISVDPVPREEFDIEVEEDGDLITGLYRVIPEPETYQETCGDEVKQRNPIKLEIAYQSIGFLIQKRTEGVDGPGVRIVEHPYKLTKINQNRHPHIEDCERDQVSTKFHLEPFSTTGKAKSSLIEFETECIIGDMWRTKTEYKYSIQIDRVLTKGTYRATYIQSSKTCNAEFEFELEKVKGD